MKETTDKETKKQSTTIVEGLAGKASAVDPQGFKDALRAQIKAAGGVGALMHGAGGGDALVKSLMKPFFELMLECEMDEHLGYAKYEPRAVESAENYRNGKTSKRIRGDFGEVTIDSPRDREGSFEPQLIKKRQTSVGNFTDKIVSLYARGMTTREIEEHLKEVYEIEVSAQFISRATERIEEEAIEWQTRPLDRVYPVVYVDGLRVSIRNNNGKGSPGPVVKKCVYVVLGVSTSGLQEVLGLWVEETEGARFWLKVFNDLKARGVQDILILCGDGLSGLPDAVAAVYPATDVQLCVVHHVRNVTKFVAWKDRKQFCGDMREIYCAPTTEAAALALDKLDDKWGRQYPASIASWRRNWHLLTTFFKYPVELRRIIYTTNAIESLNAQLRKNTSNRRVFPSDEAALKLLFLNVRNFTAKWTKRQGWDMVMNQLSVIFGNRLTSEILEND